MCLVLRVGGMGVGWEFPSSWDLRATKETCQTLEI